MLQIHEKLFKFLHCIFVEDNYLKYNFACLPEDIKYCIVLSFYSRVTVKAKLVLVHMVRVSVLSGQFLFLFFFLVYKCHTQTYSRFDILAPTVLFEFNTIALWFFFRYFMYAKKAAALALILAEHLYC